MPSYAYISILVKRTPFAEQELGRLDRLLRGGDSAIAYHPRMALDNAVESFIRADDPDALLAEAPVSLYPVTDDQPYFFNFTRWSDLGRARDSIDSEIAISQGNPLFLFGQLGLALIASLILRGILGFLSHFVGGSIVGRP